MAEVIGTIASVITLAGLFKSCLDAFDLIQAGRRAEIDISKLKLRLDIEKCRLYLWGESLGLTSVTDKKSQKLQTRLCPFESVIEDALRVLLSLFEDTSKIESRYGVRRCSSLDAAADPFEETGVQATVNKLASAFRNYDVHIPRTSNVGLQHKTRWVIRDREKFSLLISEVKELVDGLHNVTQALSSRAQQEEMMTGRFGLIVDQATLTMVSEVCEEDYPDVSEAASVSLDAYSMATTQKQDIEEWTDDIDHDGDEEVDEEDIENLTVSELQQKLREIMSRQAEKKRIEGFSRPDPSRSLHAEDDVWYVYDDCYDDGQSHKREGEWIHPYVEENQRQGDKSRPPSPLLPAPPQERERDREEATAGRNEPGESKFSAALRWTEAARESMSEIPTRSPSLEFLQAWQERERDRVGWSHVEDEPMGVVLPSTIAESGVHASPEENSVHPLGYSRRAINWANRAFEAQPAGKANQRKLHAWKIGDDSRIYTPNGL